MKLITCLLMIGYGILPMTGFTEADLASRPVKAYIAIIIDDLGYKQLEDQRALALPAAVTLSFLPQSPLAGELAEQGFLQGNEIMLHLPMQSVEAACLGPGALTMDMNETDFKASVTKSLQSIPHVKGINNHMGSLLTREPGHMTWLMELIQPKALFFVDSRTTTETIAEVIADDFQIPNARRNVFLDHDLHPLAIEEQFNRLLNLARREGFAIAIAHPHKETLDLLEQRLAQLNTAGIELLPVSELIQAQQARDNFIPQPRRPSAWQMSLSPSHQDAKN